MHVTTGVILPEASEAITGVVADILNMLTVFGIRNSPADKTRF